MHLICVVVLFQNQTENMNDSSCFKGYLHIFDQTNAFYNENVPHF